MKGERAMKRTLTWMLVLLLCVQSFAGAAVAQEGAYTPGTYSGTGYGNNGAIVVDVRVTKDAITAIDIVESRETFYMCEKPYSVIPRGVLEAQSLAVDGVSGATNTSRGLLGAIEDALGKAGADVEALRAAGPVEEVDTEMDCDVAVVGAGIAGLSAASRLLDMGVDVVLVEQLDITGGCAKFSGGSFRVATQADKYDAVLDTWLNASKIGRAGASDQYPNMDKLTNMLRQSTETIRWFREDMGIEMRVSDEAGTYIDTVAPEGYEHIKLFKGNFLTAGIENYYTGKGGTLLLGTEATGLIQDDQGSVTGVRCRQKNGTLTLNAKAVILATGSYSHNEALKARYLPQTQGQLSACSIGDTGTGILMALDAGAVLYDDPFVAGANANQYPIKALQTENGDSCYGDSTPASMFVSFSGTRNCSETGRVVNFYENLDDLNGYYGIYDAELLEELGRTQAYDALVETDDVYFKADTVEELAKAIQVDPLVLSSEIALYNQSCANGVDERYGKASGLLSAIDKAPYYAVKYVFVNNDLVHGIATSTDAQVLREDGSAIGGLYAAGYISSRDFFDEGNLGGACLALCSTMGRIAADSAARHIG